MSQVGAGGTGAAYRPNYNLYETRKNKKTHIEAANRGFGAPASTLQIDEPRPALSTTR